MKLKRFGITGLLLAVILTGAFICGAAAIKYKVFAADVEYVAIVYVFSSGPDSSSTGSSQNNLGHAFIMVENVSSSSRVVGKMTVSAGDYVTLGTWGNQSAHNGLWYNAESYYCDNGMYDGRVSLGRYMSAGDLNTLNAEINDSDNDKWTPLKNCSTFAQNVWNSVSSQKLSAGWPIDTPSGLIKSIKKQSSYGTNQYVGYNMNVGYYSGNTFVPVSTSALRSGAGQQLSAIDGETSFPVGITETTLYEELYKAKVA